jgi:DNA-binding NarL/FixJ family response regulator
VFSVVIADDHELYRDGLSALLESQGTFAVLAKVGDGSAALSAVDVLQPDLLVLDVNMGNSPVECTIRSAKRRAPAISVAVLTMHSDRILREQVLRAGADTFMTKTVTKLELLAELSRVVSTLTPPDLPAFEKQLLSPRECEVLRLLAQAMSNKQIASWLSISEGTVKRHTGNIYEKLSARSRIDAVEKGRLVGLV